MVDLFENSSETNVKLDIKAIAITKHKSSSQEIDAINEQRSYEQFFRRTNWILR